MAGPAGVHRRSLAPPPSRGEGQVVDDGPTQRHVAAKGDRIGVSLEQRRGADAAAFPDVQNFANLKAGGQLTSPQDAATRVLAWLERADFGANPVADVRDA